MKKSQIQVEPHVYKTLDYIDKPRWISLWSQIYEVDRTKPNTVLEIGIGNKLVSETLNLIGYRVTTIDIDRRLNPDIVGDVRKLPFPPNKFDTILCAEVLEHMPFTDVPSALKELHRVARRFVILTLPHDYLTYFSVSGKVFPYIKQISLLAAIPRLQKHTFDGQHHWEIGKRGYSLGRIKNLIRNSGFSIDKTYRLFENPYHRFFILSKET